MKKVPAARLTEDYTTRNHVRLVRGGKDYFDLLLTLINNAKQTIYLQFYIYDDDETGKAVTQALQQAAAGGVQIFLLVDGYASQKLTKHFIQDIRGAGIHFKWFEPLFKSTHFYFGRRLHHKVVVADGTYSLVGGINISNRYNDMPGQPAWLDMALYCEGEGSFVLHRVCRNMWRNKDTKEIIEPAAIEQFCTRIPENDHHSVRVSRNDWVKRKNAIWKSYLYMFRHAEEEIIIMCSYFLPGRVHRNAISRASRRGVKIKVILASKSDVAVAKSAERYLYDWMLRNKIEIYEYQANILHAKVAVYDSRWSTVGSYNVNNISAYASLELNLDVRNRPFAQKVKVTLEQIIETDCKRITPENYKSSTHIFRRFWQRLCYSFINNVLNLFTFYFRQKE